MSEARPKFQLKLAADALRYRFLAVLNYAVLRHCMSTGATLEQLAHKIGWTPKQYAATLAGRRKLRLRGVAEIAVSIDCEIDFRVVPITPFPVNPSQNMEGDNG